MVKMKPNPGLYASLLPVLLPVLLVACSASKPDLQVQASEPLGRAKIEQVLHGHILSRSGGLAWRTWRIDLAHRANGTMVGVRERSGRTETAEGVWLANRRNLYCQQWNNDWGGGRPACFRVSRAGDLLVLDQVDGSRHGGERIVYELLHR